MRTDVPDAIKHVTKPDLVDLSRKARRRHLGVGRRVDWLAAHLHDRATGVLRAVLLESSPRPCYRCLILTKRADGAIEHFSLDVLPADFDRLPDISGQELLGLTRWALYQIPVSPLPAEYQAERDAQVGPPASGGR